MIAAIAAAGSPLTLVIVILALVAVIVVALAVVAVLVWDKPPYWRLHASPRRAVIDARDAVRVWKIRRRHPEAFTDQPAGGQNDSVSLDDVLRPSLSVEAIMAAIKKSGGVAGPDIPPPGSAAEPTVAPVPERKGQPNGV